MRIANVLAYGNLVCGKYQRHSAENRQPGRSGATTTKKKRMPLHVDCVKPLPNHTQTNGATQASVTAHSHYHYDNVMWTAM